MDGQNNLRAIAFMVVIKWTCVRLRWLFRFQRQHWKVIPLLTLLHHFAFIDLDANSFLYN